MEQRLKARSEEQTTRIEQQAKVIVDHETRIKMLEDAFKMAFENGANSLEKFLTKLDAKDEPKNGDSQNGERQPAQIGNGEDQEEEIATTTVETAEEETDGETVAS